ncbi:flagellin [Vogesella sp. XCS3]|uniref:flagellin N-terminal helical domain-containing protein n=1 Tax=Vogesella sp. XCS3 TaxID=2877939 RepID=UPI001D0B736B|nr:flagellin [Vogesella sp. XCS3]UDM15653.1 flagellin FliC [Vogesella sp. XCS3]
MSIIVNSNIASLNAQRNLNMSNTALAGSLQKLSSGLRVNSAKDDAAGLAVAEGLTSQIRGNNQGVRNAYDGISVAQTAESALGQVGNNLQRIREVAVQAANGGVSDDNRSQLQKEVDQLTQEISRIVQTTNFNGTKLLTGGSGLTFQVGASGSADNQVATSGVEMSGIAGYSGSLTATGTVNVSSSGAASAAIASMDASIRTVTNTRATFGSVQNRFEAVIANMQAFTENLSASRSRIMDTDFAAETAQLTRNQILQQAGTSILGQANQVPQAAISLLRG